MDYKAFVSSTFIDLKEHRAHVIRELRRAGFFVDPMEDWTAATDEPKELCRRRLEGCHLCVLLVARRRGCVPAGETLSITQMEYHEALRRGIDVLPYVLADDAAWPTEYDNRDAEYVRWLGELRSRHVVEPFGADPASVNVAPALTRWVKDEGPKVALRVYLESVKQEHGRIQFVSLPLLQDNADAPISRLFVEPAVADR
jgi:hypothetical protein